MAKDPEPPICYFDLAAFRKHVTDPGSVSDLVTRGLIGYTEEPLTIQHAANLQELESGKAVLGLSKDQEQFVEGTTVWILQKLEGWGCGGEWASIHSDLELHILDTPEGRKVIPSEATE